MKKNCAMLLVLILAVGCSPSPPHYDAADPYVASTTSEVFHRRFCAHARRMHASSKESFPVKALAVAARNRPCKTCRP